MDAMNNVVPLVTTPGRYDYLGKLIVDFDAGGQVVGVDVNNSGLIRVAEADGLIPDANTVATVQDPVEAFLGTSTPIGSTELELSFLRADVRSRSTNFGALTTDAYLTLGREEAPKLGVTAPLIAIQNGGGIRDDNIPSPFFADQTLLDLDIRNVLPFDNDVVLVENFDTDRLLALLEEAVDSVPNASGGFAQVGGFTFTFDPSQPEDARVVDVDVEGVGLVIDDGQVVIPTEFALITNSFSWSQDGDGYPLSDLPGTVILDGDAGAPGYAQAVINYISDDLGGVVPMSMYDASMVAERIVEVPEPSSLVLAGIAYLFMAARLASGKRCRI
jgi:5'-nucleotidase